MTPEEMFDVFVDEDSPAGREFVRRVMKQIQNRSKAGIDGAIKRLADATPSDSDARAGDDGDVTVVMPREDAKTLLALAIYGRTAATRGYVRGEGLADDEPK